MAELPVEFYILIFSSVILVIAIVTSFYRFLKIQYKQFLYMALHWFGLAVWINLFLAQVFILVFEIDSTVDILSNLPFVSDLLNFFRFDTLIFSEPSSLAYLLGLIGLFGLIPTTFFLILLVDSIGRTSIDLKKMTILGLVAGMILVTALQPGQAAKSIYRDTYFASVMLQTYWSSLWIIYALKLYINSPENSNFKIPSFMIFVGTILTGVIPSFNTATGLIPAGMGISELSFTVGVLLIVSSFIYQPGLLFILPYETSRLGVFNENGVPLFSHRWISSLDDQYSEMFYAEIKGGVSTILIEALQHENIREIHLDKAILIIKKHKNFSFVLLSSKTSKSLINSLSTFSERFVIKFEEMLSKDIVDPKDYEIASTLVSECFPFIPEYS